MPSTNMPKVACQSCGKEYRWNADFVGKRVRCKCGEVFVMPTQAPQAEPEFSLDSLLPEDERTAEAAASGPSCPSCHAAVKEGAVICLSCGYNLQSGKQVKTQVGGVVRLPGKALNKPRRVTLSGVGAGGFVDRWRRAWEMTKISYGILWDFKQLVLFPVFSATATVLILISFIIPLWGLGTLEQMSQATGHGAGAIHPIAYVIAFLFYFCCNFVMVFFNTALTACAMRVTSGEAPTLKDGLSVAIQRIPQIVAWAIVASTVDLLIKIIENSHKKAGRFIAMFLGGAWTIMTYFVVPVLCVESVGPFTAVKRSMQTLFDTWGEGIVGNGAMGLINFLIMLPIVAIAIGGVMFGAAAGSATMLLGSIFFGIVMILLASAVTSAAKGVLKALLYNYATGRSLPSDIDASAFALAFGSR